MVDPSKGLIGVIIALMAGGGWTFVTGLINARRKREGGSHDKEPVASQVDASILAIARARDELEDENSRLRRTHAEEREAWEREKTRMREEISALQREIERVRREADERYAALLEQVRSLRRRTDPSTPHSGVEPPRAEGEG